MFSNEKGTLRFLYQVNMCVRRLARLREMFCGRGSHKMLVRPTRSVANWSDYIAYRKEFRLRQDNGSIKE